MLSIHHTNYEHNPVFSCDEAKWVDVPWKRVKSLLLQNKNKTNFYMIVLPDYKKLNTNTIRNHFWNTKLSFVSPETMQEKIRVKPWHVSPFALLNNTDSDIQVVFDTELQDTEVWFHPWKNDNTVVLYMSWVEQYLEYIWNTYYYINL